VADRVDREVLRLSTESGQYFADLDKAIRKGDDLTGAFKRSGSAAKGLSRDWRDFGRALESTKSPLDRMQAGLGGAVSLAKNFMAGIGLGIGIAGIVSFGQKVLAAAGEIKDLGDKLDLSYEAVQRFKFAAEQTGTSIEAVDRSLIFMNKTLGAGEASTVALLKELGLDFERLRNQKGEKTILEIFEAIKKVPDPIRQTVLMTKLLGKTSTELLPAVREGFADLAQGAKVMSDDTVQRLADAEDAWAEFTTNVTIWSGEMLGAMLRDAGAARNGWSLFFRDLAASTAGAADALLKSGGNMQAATAGLVAGHARFLGNLAKEQEAEQAATAAREKGKQSRQSTTTVVAAATAAEKAYVRELQTLADKLSGKQAAAEAAKLAAAVKKVGGEAGIARDQLPGLRDEIEALAKAGVKLDAVLERLRLPAVKWGPAPAWVESIEALFTVPPDFTIDFGFTDEKRWENFSAWYEAAKTPGAPIDYTVDFGFTDEKRWENFNAWMEELTGSTGSQQDHPVLRVFRDVATEFPKRLGSALLHGQSIRAAFRSIAVDFGSDIGRQFGESLAKEGTRLQGFFGDLFGFAGGFLVEGFTRLLAAGANETKKAREELARSEGFRNLGALYDTLREMGEAGAELAHRGLNVIGKHDQAGNERWMREVLELLRAQEEQAESLFLSYDEALALAKELGVEMAAMGGATQQAALDDLAGLRLKQFKQLLASGASFNGVLMGMSDEFQEVITQALRFGLELPPELEAVLGPLVKMGAVVDENGNRLEDLSRFKFTRSLPEAIQGLIDKLDEFLDRLARGLPAAAETGIGGAKRAFGRLAPVWGEIDLPRPDVPSYAHGTDGRYLAADTLAQIHKDEAITPRGAVPALAADIAAALRTSGSGRNITVKAPLYLGPRVVAEAVMPDFLRMIETNDGGGAESGPLTRIADAVGRRLGVG
jgi:hypothetical protein